MTTMVEKMARAIAINHGVDPDQEGPGRRHAVEVDGVTTIVTDHMGPLWTMWISDALAALKAMQGPTTGMLKAAAAEWLRVRQAHDDEAIGCDYYCAMIDAAIAEASA